MDKQSFYKGEWEWTFVDVSSDQDVASLHNLPKVKKKWIESLKEEQNSSLEMDTSEEGEEFIWGSIVYYQDAEDQSEQTVLHYSLSQETLITSKIDFSLFRATSEEQLMKNMDTAENAIEGFMILLGEIVASFLQGIDEFENQLQDLLWRVKSKNNENVLDEIMDRRHESLVWINLLIPIAEIRSAVQEAFDGEVSSGRHFRRTHRRITRCQEIIDKYDAQLREMVDLETVISSHRGNEIVKTLTVITVLFAPVTAWGAIWAMRFETMPEIKWKFGYPIALIVIALSTVGIYYYLKKKRWTDSVLKNPENRKF
ncbi:magnesium transporter CorA family protein [Planococcus salinus]|nr:magnesium transporter CorA family protein [Planococcus salinus]